MLKTLQSCLQRQVPVDMIYMTSDQLITQRKVTLYIVNDSEIRGYCHLRKSLRTFKIDRILAVYPYTVKHVKDAFYA